MSNSMNRLNQDMIYEYDSISHIRHTTGQNLNFEGIFLIPENHPKSLDLRKRLNSKESRTSAKTESVQTRLPDQTFKGSTFYEELLNEESF